MAAKFQKVVSKVFSNISRSCSQRHCFSATDKHCRAAGSRAATCVVAKTARGGGGEGAGLVGGVFVCVGGRGGAGGGAMPCSSANFLLEKTEWLHSALSDSCWLPQEESFDVKALRARFNNHAVALDSSSRDSGSPKSPRPAFGKSVLPLVTDSDLAHLRLSPTVPSPPMASPGPGRLPRPDPPAPSLAAKGAPPQWTPPLHPGGRPGIPLPGVSKVKQIVDAQQNRPKLQQRAPVPMLVPGPLQASVRASASSAPLPLRRQPQQRPPGDVTPLRRPLPPEGPLPLKPNRPPRVNIEPFLRFRHKSAPREPTKTDGESHAQLKKKEKILQVWDHVGLFLTNKKVHTTHFNF